MSYAVIIVSVRLSVFHTALHSKQLNVIRYFIQLHTTFLPHIFCEKFRVSFPITLRRYEKIHTIFNHCLVYSQLNLCEHNPPTWDRQTDGRTDDIRQQYRATRTYDVLRAVTKAYKIAVLSQRWPRDARYISRAVAEISPLEIFPTWRRPPSWIRSNRK